MSALARPSHAVVTTNHQTYQSSSSSIERTMASRSSAVRGFLAYAEATVAARRPAWRTMQQAFIREEITLDCLHHLTAEDLDDLVPLSCRAAYDAAYHNWHHSAGRHDEHSQRTSSTGCSGAARCLLVTAEGRDQGGPGEAGDQKGGGRVRREEDQRIGRGRGVRPRAGRTTSRRARKPVS